MKEPKHKIYNLIILDESGSMEYIKKATVSGFNEVVQTIKGVEKEFPNQEHLISLVTFNGLGIKTILFNELASKLEEIDESQFNPDSMTPLYDALGFSMNKLKAEIDPKSNYNVLVTILTDGEENASKEYNGRSINSLIKSLKENNWTFTYIGANHDVESFATSISISNTLSFTANNEGMTEMFLKEKNARRAYSKKISRNEDVTDKYFS